MEGVMINYAAVADHSVPLMYTAMSEVGKTMSDDEGDVRLNENPAPVWQSQGHLEKPLVDEG
jgi:uncharacterized protein